MDGFEIDGRWRMNGRLVDGGMEGGMEGGREGGRDGWIDGCVLQPKVSHFKLMLKSFAFEKNEW